jgi:hypothetical protein
VRRLLRSLRRRGLRRRGRVTSHPGLAEETVPMRPSDRCEHPSCAGPCHVGCAHDPRVLFVAASRSRVRRPSREGSGAWKYAASGSSRLSPWTRRRLA